MGVGPLGKELLDSGGQAAKLIQALTMPADNFGDLGRLAGITGANCAMFGQQSGHLVASDLALHASRGGQGQR